MRRVAVIMGSEQERDKAVLPWPQGLQLLRIWTM
jgi:hypothetical protein